MNLKPLALTFLALLAVTALLGFAAAPEAAKAGTYTVYACRTPEGGDAKPSEWRVNEGPVQSILATRDNCPAGPYELEMLPTKAHPATDHLSASVNSPPGTEIVAYKFWRSAQLAELYRYRYRELSATGYSDLDDCAADRGCYSKGDPAQPFGAANLVQMSGRTGVTGLEFLLTCGLAENVAAGCPAKAPAARLEIFGLEMAIADGSSPVIPVAPSGPLVEPNAHLTGVQPLTISATDDGGGVYQALLEVDGAVVQTSTLDENGGLCKQPFVAVQPCKSSVTGSISLDTNRFSDGAHSLRVLVSDATGTNVTAWGPVTIYTDNGRCNPRPGSDEFEVQVHLAGRKHHKGHAITIGYGHSEKVHGRVLDAAGNPVAGTEVCVAEQMAAGIGSPRRVATRVTDAHGSFSYRVKPGPSERVYFIKRGPLGAAVDSVAVRVRAPISLHGSRLSLVNGQTLTMRGGLLSPPYPKRGALVELQAYRETGWQTFATTNSNRRGRFASRYTFSRTTGVQHYLLRARVPKQANYPFEAGASHPIKVTVAG